LRGGDKEKGVQRSSKETTTGGENPPGKKRGIRERTERKKDRGKYDTLYRSRRIGREKNGKKNEKKGLVGKRPP